MSSKITKRTITDHVVDEFGLSESLAKKYVTGFFEKILDKIEEGQPVRLTGLGCFSPSYKRSRPGRNPKTLEDKLIPERVVIRFVPSEKIREKQHDKS